MNQQMELFEKQSIECGYDHGPVYNNKEIIATGMGDFYVTNTHGTKQQKQYGKRINLDGKASTALRISEFGFKLSDFEDVALNKFGLKEVAKYGNETLVVTANGLFVIYSGGLSSLPGMPSEILSVTGVWVTEDGSVKAPKYSLFNATYNSINALICMTTSFREIPDSILDNTHWISGTGMTDATSDYAIPCTGFEGEEVHSRYVDSYPKYSPRLEWEDRVVQHNELLTINI